MQTSHVHARARHGPGPRGAVVFAVSRAPLARIRMRDEDALAHRLLPREPQKPSAGHRRARGPSTCQGCPPRCRLRFHAHPGARPEERRARRTRDSSRGGGGCEQALERGPCQGAVEAVCRARGSLRERCGDEGADGHVTRHLLVCCGVGGHHSHLEQHAQLVEADEGQHGISLRVCVSSLARLEERDEEVRVAAQPAQALASHFTQATAGPPLHGEGAG
mmetsp:Transcript_14353/g.43645  ORF Transcript_14353/g.43645 Transcript_14353/m.43645 type:complete len:220 (-) Transcript_14353:438-1097(-)